eukprot:Awhi_evm1s4405
MIATETVTSTSSKGAKVQEVDAEFRPNRNNTTLLDQIAYGTYTGGTFILPILMAVHLVYTQGWPPIYQLVMIPLSVMFLIGVPMSVCLHRYFSHAAFETTRAFQFVLALMSCLAYQQGPIWWASKHKRHHQYCDEVNDPHSWTQTGFAYSWFGWTMDMQESHIDKRYVPKLLEFPELVLIDRFWFLPQVLLNVVIYEYFGYSTMVCSNALPMLLCRLITLLFNVEYHPKHDPANCKAQDDHRVLAEIVGEAYHKDHHKYPQRAQRPGWDLPYHLFLNPCVKLGLIWNLRGDIKLN